GCGGIVQPSGTKSSCSAMSSIARVQTSNESGALEAQIAVATAFDDEAEIVLARETDPGDNIRCCLGRHCIHARGKHPGVDPPGALSGARLLADKEWVAHRPEQLAAGVAFGGNAANCERRLDANKAPSDRLLQSVPFCRARPQWVARPHAAPRRT